ncbi:hypothetical protein MASR1M45_20710 [Candidatus Kapaibacterium sp.]
MNEIDFNKWYQSNLPVNHILEIPDFIYDEIEQSQAQFLADFYSNDTLFRLPGKEVIFFEWLKENDIDVWTDLWNDELNSPYIISLSFLPLLKRNGYRGFPICDLVTQTNYYFTPAHLADKESELFVESAKTIFMNKQPMTLPQLLAMEISLEPIDIWHFAYKHNVSIADAKKAVHDLVNDELLVHLKDAEHLSTFLDF